MITDLSAAGSMPSIRLAWRYLKRNSFRTLRLKHTYCNIVTQPTNKFEISHLRRRSAARSVWSTMADTASDVDSGTMSLDVTVWEIQHSTRSQTRKINEIILQLDFFGMMYDTSDMRY